MDNKKIMRLLVFFDLPTNTKKERKSYTKFRKKLLENGFFMIQYSIYCRVCKGLQTTKKYIDFVKKLSETLELSGNIRILHITDKQYSNMELIIGTKTNEENIQTGQLIFEF